MTIKEIARELGVSISTVSLVLNNKPGVRKETRERIARVLKENDYSIKTGAGSPTDMFSCGELKFICYQTEAHLPERNEEFFAGILSGASCRARQTGFNLSIVNANYEELLQLLNTLEQQKNVLGVALLASEFDVSRAAVFERLSCPVVSIDNRFENHSISSVNTDNREGAYHALAYLYGLGHRRIGFLAASVPMGGLPEREDGYYRAMRQLGLTIEPGDVVRIDHVYNRAIEQMTAYLCAAESLPTAFFAANDVIAAGAVRALQQAGLRVPEDVSVLGFDDSSISTFVHPALTTMHIDRARMGELAIERLSDLLAGRDDVLKLDLGVTLVVRGSTAPPSDHP